MRKVATLCAACAAVVAAAVSFAGAGDDCCERCGCHCQPRKVCRLTCEEKEAPCVTYSCRCEDFCLPGPSRKCGCTCEAGCDGCEKCKPNYVPTCAQARTKAKLYKHVEMKKEKVYKWVVEYVCDHCAAQEADCSAENGAPAAEQVSSRPTFLEVVFGVKQAR